MRAAISEQESGMPAGANAMVTEQEERIAKLIYDGIMREWKAKNPVPWSRHDHKARYYRIAREVLAALKETDKV
jgi:hypothetical protein